MNLESKLDSCSVNSWISEQVVALDWYDGAREGIAKLSYPGCEFAFYLLDERCDPHGLDDRLFRLSELPPGTINAVTTSLLALGEATKPVWAPVWRFENHAEEARVSQKVNALVARGRQTPLVVLTKDIVRFEGLWSIPLDLQQDRDWFSYLGITPRL